MRNSNVEVEEINYAKAGLSAATVEALVAKAGGVAAVLNTRHATAKANNWVSSPPSAAVFARAVAADPNLIRRPLLVTGDRVIVGFDRPAYAELAATRRATSRR